MLKFYYSPLRKRVCEKQKCPCAKDLSFALKRSRLNSNFTFISGKEINILFELDEILNALQ